MNDIIRSAAYSSDPALANGIVLGEFIDGGPCFLDMDLLKRPGHVLGPTGMGKTICLHTIINQVAMRQTPMYQEFARRIGYDWEPTSIVFLTFVKGKDNRERNFMWQLAARSRMPFKVFEPTTGEYSHIYNPRAQKFYSKMGKNETAEHVAQCLDLTGSEEFGAKYFSGKDVSLLLASEQVGGPFNSYWDHHRFLSNPESYKEMGFGTREREHADQVNDHIRIMASIPPLNEHKRKGGPSEAAFEQAIDFGDTFRLPQFVYVNLDGLGDKRAHMAAKVILFDLKQAAQTLRHERKCRVLIIVDEADILVRSPGVVGLLNRIRHRDISIVLAHQYAEQTGKHGIGIDVNAAWHIDFSLPTPEAVEKMQKYAPDNIRHLLSLRLDTVVTDPEDIRRAAALAAAEVTASERWEPRYPKNLVIQLNRTGRVGWFRARYDSGATCVNGVEPYFWSFSMTKQQWDEYASERFDPLPVGMIKVPADEDFGVPAAAPAKPPAKPRNPEVIRPPSAGAAAGDAAIDKHFAERGK